MLTTRPLPLAWLLLGLLLAAPAAAQYKVVDPEGRITYTDRPPVSASHKVTPLRPSVGTASELAQLPQALRDPVQRYPVTLYTSSDGCLPCDSARQLLVKRGIPFADKLLQSNEDRRQFESIAGALEVPTLKIGGQVLRGYAPENWHSYLDAAGYPRNSALPAGYQHPNPTPLSAKPGQPRNAPEEAPPAPSLPAPANVEAEPEAPAGRIRF